MGFYNINRLYQFKEIEPGKFETIQIGRKTTITTLIDTGKTHWFRGKMYWDTNLKLERPCDALTDFIIKNKRNKYMKLKEAVTVLLFNQGKILGVSRKDNTSSFGLIGGKLEVGETHEQAAIREAKEETGLDVFGLHKVFEREDEEWHSITFAAQWKGEINTMEAGKVEWITFKELKEGNFGEYNKWLEEHLKNEGYFN